jgi:hypothetical protein
MRILSLISFGILTNIVYNSIATNQIYKKLQNMQVSPTYGFPYLIDSMDKELIIFCLASCNSNPNCLTVIFQKNVINMKSVFCFMYSKNFADKELSASIGFDLYEKKSIPSLTTSTIQTLSTNSSISPDTSTQSLVETSQLTGSRITTIQTLSINLSSLPDTSTPSLVETSQLTGSTIQLFKRYPPIR